MPPLSPSSELPAKAPPPKGFRLLPGWFSPGAQAVLVAEVLAAVEQAPFRSPVTPWGKPMSVRMSNMGPFGWTSDRQGYRYVDRHPESGEPWPAIPAMVLDLWTELAPEAPPPDSCLINLYRDGARMSLHQDSDEWDLKAPVVSVSLGDTALFRLGGSVRTGPTVSFRLASGDVCVLDGAARMAFHGIDRVIAGSSRLIPGGGRINLTLRRARHKNSR